MYPTEQKKTYARLFGAYAMYTLFIRPVYQVYFYYVD